VSLDTALWYAGIVMEAAFLALLIYRRVFQTLPLFFSYIVWALCGDVAMMLVSRRFGDQSTTYLRVLVIEVAIDYLIQLSVLVELAWAILRPVRTALPRGAIVAVAALVLIAAAVIWPFAGISVLKNLSTQWHLLLHLKQTVSILRVVFFLVIAACSQVLALGWRNRELQVATGLGFFSLASLGAAMSQVHQANATLYHYADAFVAASYFCSLLYWSVSFAQVEAARHEFSPKMQNFVLSLAGVARANRVALTDHPRRRDGER
jgi:hypothetical protein